MTGLCTAHADGGESWGPPQSSTSSCSFSIATKALEQLADLDGQGVDVRPQREARLRLGPDGGDDAGHRHRVLEGDAHRLELLPQVRAGALLLETQLRVFVQRPAQLPLCKRLLCSTARRQGSGEVVMRGATILREERAPPESVK